MKTLFIVIVLIILVGGGAWFAHSMGILKNIGTVPTGSDGQGIAPYTSGIRGTVFLGPLCPVESDPPDPDCADKKYATEVSVSRAGSSSVFATTKSDANGMFEFSLAPGAYTVTAHGNSTISFCDVVDVAVGPGRYADATISCDTGIR